MTSQAHTSRWRVIDAVNFIQEQIALASHCQELIHYYDNEIANLDAESHDMDPASPNNPILKRWVQEDLLASINIQRRSMMKMIEESFQWNHLHRCQLKHAIASYQFATEVLYAQSEGKIWYPTFEFIQKKAYENMIGVLSLFTNQEEFVTCGRCLDDMLSSK